MFNNEFVKTNVIMSQKPTNKFSYHLSHIYSPNESLFLHSTHLGKLPLIYENKSSIFKKANVHIGPQHLEQDSLTNLISTLR